MMDCCKGRQRLTFADFHRGDRRFSVRTARDRNERTGESISTVQAPQISATLVTTTIGDGEMEFVA